MLESISPRRNRRLQSLLTAAALLLPLAFSYTPAAIAAPATAKAAAKPAAAPAVDAALRQRIESAPQGVAGLHRGNSGALNCGKCHGSSVAPDDNQRVENKECVACHGDYAELAVETAKKLTNKALNPHASHLGPEIACTSCHLGHQESKAYCLNCHTNFTMPMPGNAARAAAP